MLLAGALLLVVLVAAGLFVILPVARDLSAAKSVLARPPADLTDADIAAARTHLDSARDRLGSIPARALGIVPVVGSNLAAVRAVTEEAARELDAGGAVAAVLETTDRAGVIDEGAVNVQLLDDLAGPLEDQLAALRTLQDVLSEHRTGSLAPPLWTAFDELLDRTGGLVEGTGAAVRLLESSPGLLGEDAPRRYLVMLVNNAELRGAGGILAGVGTLEVIDGRLELGPFHSVHDLAQDPPEEVPAPAEYERRFGVYKANTTLWLNATFSPDFPDVALVASRLFRHVTGIRTDGVLQVDPVALAALLPPGTRIEVPGADTELQSSEVARFVYSEAYEQFRDQEQRRDALLQVGKKAFQAILSEGVGGSDALGRIGDALAGGHVRFVSFDRQERAALDASGVSGDVAPVAGDSLLVTTQNFGSGIDVGTKLDYWARRVVGHRCQIAADEPSRCISSVELGNEAPKGLPRYVAGSPYGLLRSYVEVYVPQEARLVSVELDGSPVEFRAEPQAGRRAVGVFVQMPPGEARSLEVAYELPESDSYTFQAIPQPLATDATIDVSVKLPQDWAADYSGFEEQPGVVRYRGPFDRNLELSAGPSEKTGLPAWWEDLQEFWRDPAF